MLNCIAIIQNKDKYGLEYSSEQPHIRKKFRVMS